MDVKITSLALRNHQARPGPAVDILPGFSSHVWPPQIAGEPAQRSSPGLLEVALLQPCLYFEPERGYFAAPAAVETDWPGTGSVDLVEVDPAASLAPDRPAVAGSADPVGFG